MHVITTLGIGGAEQMLLRLLGQGAERWISRVVCLAESSDSIAGRFAELDIPITTVGMKRGLPAPGDAGRFFGAVRGFEFDLLQGWMYHGNLAAVAARIALRRRVPVVWNVRGGHESLRREELGTAAVMWLCGRVSRLADAIVYNSERAAEVHERNLGYDSRKRVLIPNGFDTVEFAPSSRARIEIRSGLGIPTATRLVGLVARYHKVKDHPTFLRAAQRVTSADAGVHIVLVGEGCDDRNSELTALIGQLGLQGRISMLGVRSDVARVTAALDVAVSSSRDEGFSNSLGEAMSCGVPVVGTDVGATRMLVADAGEIVSPADPEALAVAIGRILALDAAQRERLSHRGRARIQEFFSIAATADKYDELYKRVSGVSSGHLEDQVGGPGNPRRTLGRPD